MERILKVYTDDHGPSIVFIKALLYLYKKYGYVFDTSDHKDAINTLFNKEFDAVFINDQWPKLVFSSKKQKLMFELKFN